jgi:hypothetical protein
MLLANDVGSNDSSSSAHCFLYAQVIGTYHENIIYVGPGMLDYQPRCVDLLWVQWFKLVNPVSPGWSTLKLDMVTFPPMNMNYSFGFVDPSDVLHMCHRLPGFAKG